MLCLLLSPLLQKVQNMVEVFFHLFYVPHQKKNEIRMLTVALSALSVYF